MKTLILFLFCSQASAQGVANSFMQGYKDASTVRENDRRDEELQMQREQAELQRKQYYEEQERRNIQAYENEQRNEEVRKREDLKMKLEALKHGYEITEDGELKKIEPKPKRKGASTK